MKPKYKVLLRFFVFFFLAALLYVILAEAFPDYRFMRLIPPVLFGVISMRYMPKDFIPDIVIKVMGYIYPGKK